MARAIFEYRIELPATVVKAHPESIYYLFEAGSKAKRERVDWPERVNRQDYPQTDMARTWPSTLAVSFNGRLIERINLPDDAADARGVLSHLAGVEHGSHGELVDGKIDLTDRDRARPGRRRAAGPSPGRPRRRTARRRPLHLRRHRPASYPWIRPWRSILATPCPPTWASTPIRALPYPPVLETRVERPHSCGPRSRNWEPSPVKSQCGSTPVTSMNRRMR